ncbi:hypothetical protein GO730_27430 [Spirosoma sp. HMF3257]|uniref:Uncharacterized protein n=1 Tax=Spirosoma telluris TaxID=2183553 RepID=A0A327NQG7_9BACT|nr:hypothetical protein [Spirosoma telluris]RAI76965.1 hypothetical protein HMF3257_27350 [Spirosoma telluris]
MENVYRTNGFGDCGTTRGGTLTNGAYAPSFFYLDINVKVTAPSYGISDTGNIVIVSTGGSNSAGGGNGGTPQKGPTPPDDPARQQLKFFARTVSSLCVAQTLLWQYSYQNNSQANTVEMGGFILDDGSFFMLPWGQNTGVSIKYAFEGNAILGSNGHIYHVTTNTTTGQTILQDENPLSGSTTSTDHVIVSYVHTHPWDDGLHATDEVTRGPDPLNPNIAPYGDWAFGKEWGLPGIIITPDYFLYFHYDGTKTTEEEQKVKDGRVKRDSVCDPGGN